MTRVTKILVSISLLPLLGLCASCSDDGTAPQSFGVRVVEAFPNLSFPRPVDIQNAGDGSNRLFVVEQAGRILVFENDPATSVTTVFLDISTQVT